MSDYMDEQSTAEELDDDVTGLDEPVTSDEAHVDYPPDHFGGVPFADSDVTDESFADRVTQEEPEVWEGR